jgi:hypothetical protein
MYNCESRDSQWRLGNYQATVNTSLKAGCSVHREGGKKDRCSVLLGSLPVLQFHINTSNIQGVDHVYLCISAMSLSC